MNRTVRYTLTLNDVEMAFALHWAMRPQKRLLILPLLALAVPLAVAWLVPAFRQCWQCNLTPLAYVVALYVLIILLNKLWFIPRAAKRLYAQQHDMRTEKTVTWDEAAITVTSVESHRITAVADFYQWAEDRHFILIYLSEAFLLMLPKRDFTLEQVADLTTLLRSCGVAERSRPLFRK